ncbi:hypothetical protein [Runella aurantiaca]|uniref:Uncharacterized protein n=1 Tax=Runella aurantiaca TaxID=2282308 RepID=A0A369I647_9BACT|nr:hypothetical protein [Runella aurantiaca]RDB03725.1 hypothetical protein DVG78_21810 [Runella aurantiaca]
MTNVDEQLVEEWEELLNVLEKVLGKRPADLNGVLFLIGVQELGKGPITFTKEQKQDLMHIAICKVLSLSGFYELEGLDKDGWPHWRVVEKLPHFSLISQETLLKMHVIRYFKEELEFF